MLKKAALPTFEKVQEGINHSLSAYYECLKSAAYMLRKGVETGHTDHVTLLYDCADANLMLVNSLSRGSGFYIHLARPAHDLNTECSDMCAKFESDHEQLRVCYAAVLRAADTTARLAGLVDAEESPEEVLHDSILKESFPASDPPPSS